MKKYVLIILMLASMCLNAQNDGNAVKFTLDDCLRYAVSNSYDRKSMELTKKSQQLSYEQSKMERLPNVNASLSESYGNSNNDSGFSGSAGINAGMTLYQGGQINTTIEQEKLSLEQSEIQVNQYDDQLSIQILQAFLTVLGNEELVKYQEAVLKSSLEALKQGEEKYKVGAIIESDYLLLAAQYATDTNNIVDTKIAIENNYLNLKVLLSMDPLTELEIIYPDTTSLEQMATFPTIDEAVEQSLAYSPDLKISKYDISIAEKSLRLTKSNYYPSVNLSAGINTGHNDFTDFGTQLSDRLSEQIGVSVSIPIYSRGSTKTKVKQSEIALERTQLAYQQDILSTRQTVVQEYRNLVSTYNQYQVSKLKQEAYLKSFEAYNVQFRYGSITAVELLQQQNNYLNALNSFIQNKYSFILQRKIMDVYMGKGITM